MTYQVSSIELSNHIRGNVSRADRVDGDSSGRKFLGIGHAHCHDSTLGGGVVGLSRISDLTDDRRNIDNATRALLGRQFEKGLCAVKDSRQVDINHRLPLLGLHAQH